MIITTTMGSSEAQKLIALSLGKIAMSRQQRGGINLHKNLLVASVLHRARTCYMMDNFQTLIATKKSQAEKQAAERMIVESSSDSSAEKSDNRQSESMEVSQKSRGFTDCDRVNNQGAPQGERPERRTEACTDKENVVPEVQSNIVDSSSLSDSCSRKNDQKVKKSCVREVKDCQSNVTGKPLSVHNGSSDYVSQSSCRCAGGKRRRPFVGVESGTEPKKPRYEDGYENYSDSEFESEEIETKDHEKMETTQVTNLVNIFNRSTGLNGLFKEEQEQQSAQGQVNVYVSADRSINGHHYVLSDVSCATQYKDSVSVPTAIALAV